MMVRCVGALLLGSASVFGFAPFGVSVLPLLTLCGLFALWYRESSRDCWWTGLAFGLGLFGTGTSWIYVALASFGGMPVVLACIATAAFCAFLALFPAVTGWLAASVAPAGSPLRLALAAACWTLTEWLRGWIFSGFPWLSFGHAQVTGPLAGYAPIGGAYLVGLVLASLAALVVFAAM